MFNTYNYNTLNYNALAGAFATVADQDDIVFNDFSLQNTDIVSSILLQDDTPSREFRTFPIPRDDGENIVLDLWRNKIVSIEGFVRKTTSALLETELDDMKKALAVREGILDIKTSGVIRRYVATMTNGAGMFSQRRHFHITLVPFKISFKTVEPFGKDVDYNATTFLNKTDLVFTEQAINEGTIHARPIIILNFSAVSGITAVSFKNNTTSEEIKVTTTINAGDYLRFDSEIREVTINGVQTDFTGTFPQLDTGGNSYTITLTGTSATYTLTVKHKNNYL